MKTFLTVKKPPLTYLCHKLLCQLRVHHRGIHHEWSPASLAYWGLLLSRKVPFEISGPSLTASFIAWPQWTYCLTCLLLYFQRHPPGLYTHPAWQLAVATEKSGCRFNKALNLITLWNFILCHACRLKPCLSEWGHFLQLNSKTWI